MSACDPINITFQGTAADFLAKAQQAIGKLGGVFNGNETGGTFNVNTPIGQVGGNYAITGNNLTINVTDKPMMLGCQMIEGILKNALH